MYIRIGYEFQFDLPAATHMVLMLHTHPEKAQLLQRPERIHVEPEGLRLDTFTDALGNRASRLMAPAGKLRIWQDNVIWDSGQREPGVAHLQRHTVDELPNDVLPYLLGSRYCEVDRLGPMAWDLFGKLPPTWERVQAVIDWVHRNVTFGYKHARMNKTAWDTWYERTGVCRDFQHLTITLLRALNVPARYATGYLGDIEVPSDGLPDDFSAWIEVFLGGKWVTLDARHNIPRVGRILMARGRDATDVAMTTAFGSARLERFRVWTDEVAADAVCQPDSICVPPTAILPAPAPAMIPFAAQDIAVQSPSDKPLMPYASHVAHGTGRTPIGIILFACSHLLLGGVLLLTDWILLRGLALAPPGAIAPLEWLVVPLIAAAALPMLVGAVAMLLKGHVAWAIGVASFMLLAVFEAMAIAYALGMTVRYMRQGNPDVQWAMIFLGFAVGLAFLCRVVVGYLAHEKARVTFGLPPGQTPPLLQMLPRLALLSYAVAAAIGPFLSGVRDLYPD